MADMPHFAELALREWGYKQDRKEILKELQALNADMERQIENRTAELREAHAENKQILEAIHSILITVDKSNCVVSWNRSAEETFGRSASAMSSLSLDNCDLPWDWERICAETHICRDQKESVRIENVRFTRADGRDGFLGIMLNPILDETGKFAGILILGADITERLFLETQLNQAQKLESIGRLAAGIAHEMNTPMQYVGDNINFLKESFTDLLDLQKEYARLHDAATQGQVTDQMLSEVTRAIKETDVEYLVTEIPPAIEQTMEGIQRVTQIVHAMKEFAHPGSEEKKSTNIAQAIESTLTVARNEWKYVAKLETDFDPDLPLVPCFPGEFNQVILNLIVNAAHAITDVVGDGAEGQGLISISARQQDDDVEIRLADSGTGIPPEVCSKIFDPFFTTKEVGKGTGQGLALAHDVIVGKHGGTISVESEVGEGTTFVIRLPLTSAVETAQEEAFHA